MCNRVSVLNGSLFFICQKAFIDVKTDIILQKIFHVINTAIYITGPFAILVKDHQYLHRM